MRRPPVPTFPLWYMKKSENIYSIWIPSRPELPLPPSASLTSDVHNFHSLFTGFVTLCINMCSSFVQSFSEQHLVLSTKTNGPPDCGQSCTDISTPLRTQFLCCHPSTYLYVLNCSLFLHLYEPHLHFRETDHQRLVFLWWQFVLCYGQVLAVLLLRFGHFIAASPLYATSPMTC